MNDPKVIVVVLGGVVQAVYSTIPIGVDILDHDNLEALQAVKAPDEHQKDDRERYEAIQREIDDTDKGIRTELKQVF